MGGQDDMVYDAHGSGRQEAHAPATWESSGVVRRPETGVRGRFRPEPWMEF